KVLRLARAESDGQKFIIVSQVGSYTFGIVVDRVFETEEIVVKPVGPKLRDVGMFSGNTILGDGSVIMILDPNGIAEAAGAARMTEADRTGEEQRRQARASEMTSLLVCRSGSGQLKAVPLSLVERLEKIDVAQIEVVEGQHVVQYRGALMPLVK